MKMTLLISHSAALNLDKVARHFGALDGELLISSAGLYEQATKLCLAYSDHKPPPPCLNTVLSRAKRYTILLADDEDSAPVSMSPSIIEDIASRTLEREWDRVAIIANCCQYANRLNSAQLQSDKHSLSLTILTLVLMNGEILSNHPGDKLDSKKMTITEFLHEHFFYGLESPWKKAKLTFNKRCRFANVVLTEDDIQTEGYLWRLDDEIITTQFQNCRQPRGRKRHWQFTKRPLEWLAEDLAPHYRLLSQRLYEIMDLEVPSSAAEEWLLSMVDAVEEAIDQGKLLCTATLLGSGPLGVAVFVQPEESDNEDKARYSVFTDASSTEVEISITVETTTATSSIETTTTALIGTATTAVVETTTTEPVITTTTATAVADSTATTAEASTTTQVSEAVQSIYLFGVGSYDPAVELVRGAGYTKLSDTSTPGTSYLDFTSDVGSNLLFILDPGYGKLKIGNGAQAGKTAMCSAVNDIRLVVVMDEAEGLGNGLSPLDCEIVLDGLYQLKCKFSDLDGYADFWTCGTHLILVKPGVDATTMCSRATTSYRLPQIRILGPI
ncbi:Uncharacterized protein LW94_5246 [Fusarium fujikuroi]|nr:Uncharacterized protein LW94_5246 [Fusarium fujikuroi]